MTSSNYIKHINMHGIKGKMINLFYDIIISELRKDKPLNIIDVGCGEGFFLGKVQKEGIANLLYGFDISEDSLEIAREITGLPVKHLWRGDIYNIQLPTNSFDLLCCFEVLEHLTYPEEALKAIFTLGIPLVYLSVPKEPFFCLGNLIVGKNISRLGNDPDHKNIWTGWGFKRFVKKTIGTDYMIKTFSPVIFPWTLLKCKLLSRN